MPGYPTPPGTRIAYDLDGSFVFITDAVTRKQSDVVAAAIRALNAEYNGGLQIDGSLGWTGAPYNYLTVIFPTPRELTAVMAVQTQVQGSTGTSRRAGTPEVWVSPDSTNGIDGSWSQIVSNGTTIPYDPDDFLGSTVNAITGAVISSGGYASMPKFFTPHNILDNFIGYRVVSGTAVRQVRAVQIRVTNTIGSFTNPVTLKLHVYGKDDTTASTQRLEFWKATSNLRIDGGDLWWSDVPQASSHEKSFRLKNMSPTLTAEDIELTTQNALSTTTPNPASFYTYSLDEVSWTSTLAIPNLSPGDISAEIFIRAVIPSNAALSRWSPRIRAEVGEWT